jgi:hypothetical protein
MAALHRHAECIIVHDPEHRMNDSLALQVDRFAALMVRLDDPFEERGAVLAAEGLDEEQAASLIASWRRRFEGDATGALPLSFADAYAGRRAALRGTRRSEASCQVQPAAPRPLDAEVQSARGEVPPPAPMPARAPEQPTFALPSALAAPAAALPPAPPLKVESPPAHLAGTADISAFVPRASLPFVPGLAAPGADLPSPPGPGHPHQKPPERFTGTADISGAVALAAATMPFHSSLQVPSSGGAPVAPGLADLHARFGGTGEVDPAIAHQGQALPFGSGTASTPSMPAAGREQSTAEALPGLAAAHAMFGGTTQLDPDIVRRAALPFGSGGDAPSTVATAPAVHQDAAGVRRRLIRFDPQTGQPLPTPMWVEIPPEPEGSTR